MKELITDENIGDIKFNLITQMYYSYKHMVTNKIIYDFKFEYDDEENVLDISIIPIRTVEHLDVNFTITPDGIDFN